MAEPMNRNQQRKWLLDEIKKDAGSHAAEERKKGDGTRVYYGRLDALVRVAWHFDFAERDDLKRFINRVEQGKDPSIEDIKDPVAGK